MEFLISGPSGPSRYGLLKTPGRDAARRPEPRIYMRLRVTAAGPPMPEFLEKPSFPRNILIFLGKSGASDPRPTPAFLE